MHEDKLRCWLLDFEHQLPLLFESFIFNVYSLARAVPCDIFLDQDCTPRIPGQLFISRLSPFTHHNLFFFFLICVFFCIFDGSKVGFGPSLCTVWLTGLVNLVVYILSFLPVILRR